MSSLASRLWLLACCCLATAATAQDAPPLHERVDVLIDAGVVGPLSPPASDADFLRRVYLDLTGVIPTATEARAWLADPSPDKRTKLIQQLLESPNYARHMTLTFDVMFMERRADKAIKTKEWQAFLRQSFLENKPLDQLCRELLLVDGTDEALRPAARFLLDRECEPNLVTRDVGRILFGMDLQCAQCHDHPAIDDYLQSDYYGLYSFFLRSSLFNDPAKKQAQVAEKAEGEANYKSVFTGDAADQVRPRLPHGPTAPVEPSFNKGEEYVVAPAKDVRPVPKHSRRKQLAAMLTDSEEFRRNLANRVWAHLFGRGIVHPVDGHFAANPPRHPEVLALLTEEFAKSNYNVKWLLGELAQTRAYQRSCEPVVPAAATIPPDLVASLESQRVLVEQRLKDHEATLAKQKTDLRAAKEEYKKQELALTPLGGEIKAADEALAKALTAGKQADDALGKKQQQAAAVAEAAKKVDEAAKLATTDKELAQALALLNAKLQALNAEVDSAKKTTSDLASQTQMATERAAKAKEALANARKALPTEPLAALEKAAIEAEHQAQAERFQLAALDRRIALAKSVTEYQEKAKIDTNNATPLWSQLIDRWTMAGQIAPLKSLSAEQFALSLLQATGGIEQRQQTIRANLEKTPPDAVKNAPEGDRPSLLALLTEEQTFEQLRGNLAAFVALYATQPGADFQATVNQSLFFENGAAAQSLVGSSTGNLTDRLTKLEDPNVLAEELYLATLTRFPSDEERLDVANYLKDRAGDRSIAVGELVWSLLSSNEFRFNH